MVLNRVVPELTNDLNSQSSFHTSTFLLRRYSFMRLDFSVCVRVSSSALYVAMMQNVGALDVLDEG